MVFRTKTLGLTAMFALSALALAAQAGPLTFKVKQGDEHKYRVTAVANMSGVDATFSGLRTEKFLEVNPDGSYTVENRTSDQKLSYNGQDVALPESPGSVVVAVFNANGTVKEIRGDQADASAYRVTNLMSTILGSKDTKVGEEWKHEAAADANSGAVAFAANYKITGEEKIGAFDTWKVDYNVKETEGSNPASSTGTVWLNKSDATIVRMESKWVAVPFPGSPFPIDATVKVVRE